MRTGVESFLRVDLEAATRITTVRIAGSGTNVRLITGDERGIPGSTVARATGRWKVELTATDGVLDRRHTAKFDIVGLLGASTGPVKEHPALDAATLAMESGAVANTTAIARNGSQIDVYDVEATPGRMWMAGSEHVFVVWNALTRQAVAWNAAGHGCPDQAVTRWCFNGLGGDFRFAEKIGDFVYAGCHCNRPVSNAHWSSVSRRYTDHITVNAYRVAEVPSGTTTWTDTGRTAGMVQLYEVRTEDTRGRRSFDNPSVTVTVGGPDLEPPTVPAGLTGTAGADSVTLVWTASTDDRGVDGYLVFHDGAYAGWTKATTFTDTGLAPGTYRYEVRTQDAAGNRSDKTPPVSGTAG